MKPIHMRQDNEGDERDWTPLIELVAQVRRIGVDQVTEEPLLAETELFLMGATIPEAAWPLIGALRDLASLELRGTKLTDAGLAHLKGLTGLRTLWLGGTQVTDAGLAELSQAQPDCRIFRP